MKISKIAPGILFFGIMAALSLAPLNLWFFGFFMLFPLFYIIENTNYSTKQTLLLGYLFTLSFNVLTAYWLIYTINIFGHLHISLAIIIFLLYTLITSGRYTVFLLLIKLWNFLKARENLPFQKVLENRYFAYAFAWGFSEYFGWQLFHALGANNAGGDTWLIQTADLVGTYGLSVFWFLINLMIYDLYNIFRENRSHLRFKVFLENKSLNFTLILIISLHIYGYFAYHYWKIKIQNYPTKRIALVQGNAPLSFESGRSVYAQVKATLDSILEQTSELLENEERAGKKPDLVVWPESSVPFLSIQSPGLFSQGLNELQQKYKVPMIINDVFTENTGRRPNYYNNLWLLNADGNRIGFYHKIQLLPFGEFIPLANFFPSLYNLVPEIGGFTPGRDKKILTLDSLNIIPSICYELLPPVFTLDYYKKSGQTGQIIINITNDTWFGRTTENAEHIKASSLRAIEMRLPIVRATNSGISAYINAAGDIIDPTESFIKDARVYDVPIPDKSRSIYAIIGIWPFRIFLFVGIFVWGLAFYNISLRKEN